MIERPDLSLLTQNERSFLFSLDTPGKIQDAIMAIPHNFEEGGDSCRSVSGVFRTHRAHCIEAALVAALALWVHGAPPLLLDLSANDRDDDHVVALFRRDGLWGAISKSNHAYLGFRDPVYRSLRELAMSYLHEYFNTDGEKTLREYSLPLDLRRFPVSGWVTGPDAWMIAEALCAVRHFPLLPTPQTRLRPIDALERRTTEIVAYTRAGRPSQRKVS